MVSGDESTRKGTSLSLTEESYIVKESEIQLGSRYDQFISSNDVAVRRLKVPKRFREPSIIPRRKRRLSWFIAKICQENDVPSSSRIHQFTKKYTLYRDKHYGKEKDKRKPRDHFGTFRETTFKQVRNSSLGTFMRGNDTTSVTASEKYANFPAQLSLK